MISMRDKLQVAAETAVLLGILAMGYVGLLLTPEIEAWMASLKG